MTTHNPIDTARETLKQLTMRKLLPTPDNFERVYCEIAQVPQETRKNKLAELILRAFENLPSADSSYKIALTKLRKAIEDEKWELIPQLVMDLSTLHQRSREVTQSWGQLVLDLIRAWETRTPDMGQRYKQSALERVIATFGNAPDELNEKLVNLTKTWLQPGSNNNLGIEVAGLEGDTDTTAAEPIPATASHTAISSKQWRAWMEVLQYALKFGIEPRLVHYPEMMPLFDEVQLALQQITADDEIGSFFPRLRAFLIRLELISQDDKRLVSGLSGLMQLMLQNVAELNRSDSYLVGQIASLQQILSQPNISIQHIYQLESSLKEVIHKQGNLRHSLDEATSSLRALLDTFLDKLSLMTDHTGDFHQRISSHSDRIKSSQNASELTGILQDLLSDTASMQDNLKQSHSELLAAKQDVQSAQSRIGELEKALEAASAKVKEDQLTGAFNRRGLEEHFDREIHRAERSGQPLSVALIDVDNFKQLNDRYGHLTGDDVLKYLVDMMHHSLRTSDIVGRFGGEEFVVILPDTPVNEAVELVQRLQRELTKNFFLANQDKLVVTFSAGVALWHRGEQDCDVIERADRAMYQAKLAGKNRTLSAEN
ncbi:diguanylate cyclase [Vogesella sp. DC21W]|uniref:diguanylate cyclase n=1 Tax=Vogesella aquatica TaxID=2984206 RepID=A0ABT5IXK5_9NEIS|nr:GGDEF domain-containing protein [Vogesella aquatica]MDC7717297.1 diguanylate cyclase [Vogesella aquatica]